MLRKSHCPVFHLPCQEYHNGMQRCISLRGERSLPSASINTDTGPPQGCVNLADCTEATGKSKRNKGMSLQRYGRQALQRRTNNTTSVKKYENAC